MTTITLSNTAAAIIRLAHGYLYRDSDGTIGYMSYHGFEAVDFARAYEENDAHSVNAAIERLMSEE